MNSVLYQLYEGALCPLVSQRPRIKEQQQLLERQYQQYIYLENELEKLNPALKTVLWKW